MCSGSTASRPPPQATPTPGRQATWATTGNCQPRQGKPLGQGGQRTGSPRHTHRPSRLPTASCRETPTDHTTGTPRKQQPPDHPNRVDTDSANRDTRRKPRGTSPRFESTQKHRRQCNPVTRPLLARDLGVYPAPPRAARGGGYPLLSPSPPPTVPKQTNPAAGAPPRHSPSGFMHLVNLDLTRSRQATSRGAPHQPQPHDPTGLRRPPGPE